MDYYTWVLIPVLIFIARIVDVSIGTLRIIFVARGYKYVAPVLGFFEVMVWLLAIQQIMLNLSNIACYIAYAGGFAMGTLAGLILEERISLGHVIFRIVTTKSSTKLAKTLDKSGFVETSANAYAKHGKVKVIFTISKRKDANKVCEMIALYNPKAFYTIEDVRYAKYIDLPNIKKKFTYQRKGK